MKKNYFLIAVGIVVAIFWIITENFFFEAPEPQSRPSSKNIFIQPVEEVAKVESVEETNTYKPSETSIWDIVEEYIDAPKELSKWCDETACSSVLDDVDSSYIQTLSEVRKESFELRRKAMKTSRRGYAYIKHSWGKSLKKETQLIGCETEKFATLIFKNGIVIRADCKYFFFHKITLKFVPKPWSENKVIAVKSVDGYWLPAITDKEGNITILSAWEKFADNETKKAS